MDQELKQRLIGASVIIALAIIFIPMLFDNKVEKSDDKNIDIVIPESGSHPLSVKTFSLDDEPAGEPEVNLSVPESDVSLADDRLLAREALDNTDSPSTTQAAPMTESTEPDEQTQSETQAVAENTQGNHPASATPDNTDVIEQEAEKPLEDKQPAVTESVTETSPATAETGTEQSVFRVKLGSFSKAENAQLVKNKLAQQGIGSLVELAPDKALYRVWSDRLYQTKNKADAYVATVNKLNLNIGTPKIITVSAAEVTAIADRGQLGWVVQLGSFAAKNNALDLRNKLKLAGFNAFVDISNNPAGETRYRLRVGPVNSREQATEIKQQITDKLQLKGLVKAHELATLVD